MANKSHVETLIYAELLSNIRQISIIAVLPTASNTTTQAELSSDGKQFSLQHQDRRVILTLPGRVSPNTRLTSLQLGKREISWRLPVIGLPSRPDDFNSSANEALWSARELDPEAQFSCQECQSIILERGSLTQWKDLPSENWAEMMEFWHCHKPDDKPDVEANGTSDHSSHKHREDPNTHRGYGANNRFAATKGVGFVDTSTFLVAEADVRKVTSTTSSTYAPVYCQTCHTPLGHFDPLSSGLRVYKWRLQLSLPKSRTSSRIPTTLSQFKIHTTAFATTMHAQATSRLLLSPLLLDPHPPLPQPSAPENPDSKDIAGHPNSPTHISLWILSPSIHYSATSSSTEHSLVSSEENSRNPVNQHAMKIFYQSPSDEAQIEKLQQTEGVEEVFVPQESIRSIWMALEESRRWLPESGRMFREWKVGLLERF